MVNARSKGSGGEREFANWLQTTLGLMFKPSRNLEQVRSGGADILDVKPFVFEVKRCEVLLRRDWWIKLVNQCARWEVPVVAYRQNYHKWKFLISAKNIGLDKGFIELEEMEFTHWIKSVHLFYTSKNA